MTEDECDWEWQKLRLERLLENVDGDEFQNRFQEIAKARWGSDFTGTIVMGIRGDLKCDGYLHTTQTAIACFGPRYGQVQVGRALVKIEEDFRGAKEKWDDKLSGWVCALNVYRDVVPAELIKLVRDLSEELKIPAQIWNRNDLIELSRGIPPARRRELLGRAPIPTDMRRVTYSNIGRALSIIKRPEAGNPLEPVPLPPDVIEKIEWNALPHTARHFLAIGQAGASRVRGYLRDQVIPTEAEQMTEGFKARYFECRDSGMEPEAILKQMVIFAGGATGDTDLDAAALAITSHYFSTCEIFEAPPEAAVAQ